MAPYRYLYYNPSAKKKKKQQQKKRMRAVKIKAKYIPYFYVAGGTAQFDIAVVISDCTEATKETVGSLVNTFMPTVAGRNYNSNSPIRIGVFQVRLMLPYFFLKERKCLPKHVLSCLLSDRKLS